jgi:hypothetical protein
LFCFLFGDFYGELFCWGRFEGTGLYIKLFAGWLFCAVYAWVCGFWLVFWLFWLDCFLFGDFYGELFCWGRFEGTGLYIKLFAGWLFCAVYAWVCGFWLVFWLFLLDCFLFGDFYGELFCWGRFEPIGPDSKPFKEFCCLIL